MVNIYKRRYGRYVKVGEASSIKESEAILDSMWGKGKYRIGKGTFINNVKRW